jgi:hypothetical protein
MIAVYRYDVAIEDRIEVMMPRNAVIIHVETSDRIGDTGITLWATADLDEPETTHVVYVRGTGRSLGDAGFARHIGTVQTYGKFWWHVFDGRDVVA